MEQTINSDFFAASNDATSLPSHINIYCHGFFCGEYKMVDIGHRGVTIQGGQTIPRKNSFLEVEIAFGPIYRNKRYRLPVYIHNIAFEAIELCFLDFKQGKIRDLMELFA